MNKRSKSELILKLTQQNNDLLDRIDRSKPVLQTIYDKVKKKEELLFAKINKDRRLVTDVQAIARDYKKLYQQSIQLLHKSKTLHTFPHSLTNYFPKKFPMPPIPQQNPQKSKSKSVYQQYRQRLDRTVGYHQYQKNPQIQALKLQNQDFKNQIISDIDRLRLVRATSQKKIGRGETKRADVGRDCRNTGVDLMRYKQRLVEREGGKLRKMGQQ